jgi:RimJ/RimL family protein N-acetyltransferase
MYVIETARLRLRRLGDGDAAFMLELLNDPAFIRNIGDRGVRSEADAIRYLRDGPLASYARHGYGLYLVELRDTGEAAGICGLVKREYLEDADVGFAFLPRFRRQGYALESASAVRSYAMGGLGLTRLLAITSPDNADSIRVLEKIGLRFARMVRPPGDGGEVRLFTSDA